MSVGSPPRGTLFRSFGWAIGLILLAGLDVASLSGAAARKPVPPPSKPIAPPAFNSDPFDRQMATDLRRGREKAAKSSQIVTQKFYVGWEMHHGYFLVPADGPGSFLSRELVSPDFADDDVRGQFNDFVAPGKIYPIGAKIPHLGKKIICLCTGVEWSFFGSKRFYVRAAKFSESD